MICIMLGFEKERKKIYYFRKLYGSHECTAGFKFEDGTNPTNENEFKEITIKKKKQKWNVS